MTSLLPLWVNTIVLLFTFIGSLVDDKQGICLFLTSNLALALMGYILCANRRGYTKIASIKVKIAIASTFRKLLNNLFDVFNTVLTLLLVSVLRCILQAYFLFVFSCESTHVCTECFGLYIIVLHIVCLIP